MDNVTHELTLLTHRCRLCGRHRCPPPLRGTPLAVRVRSTIKHGRAAAYAWCWRRPPVSYEMWSGEGVLVLVQCRQVK